METSANPTQITNEVFAFFANTSTRFMSPLLTYSTLDHILNTVFLTDETVPTFLLLLDENVRRVSAACCIQ
jgi:hypothetical protein